METVVISKPVTEVDYPTLSERVQSTFIDSIFICVLMFVFASVLDRYENSPDWLRIALFFGIWSIYEPVCTAVGFTIGNYIKGIRVRSHSNTNQRINILQAFGRYILKLVLGLISFLTMHTNPEKRAIHDLVVGSVMIKK